MSGQFLIFPRKFHQFAAASFPLLLSILLINCGQPPHPVLERSWNMYLLPYFEIGPYNLVVKAFVNPLVDSSSQMTDRILIVTIESESYPGKADSVGFRIDSVQVTEIRNHQSLPLPWQVGYSLDNLWSGKPYERGPVVRYQKSYQPDSIPQALIISFRARAKQDVYGPFLVRHFVTDTLYNSEGPHSTGFVYTTARKASNPFCPTGVGLSYTLPESSNVTILVYDVRGQLVDTVINERRAAGMHTESFYGFELPSGVYFYKLVAGTYTFSKKFILLK
jgi:hypothetical protein